MERSRPTLHLPERFGLFTIIVLGEAIVAVVTGVADQTWSAWSVAAAVGSVMIAVSLWWVYFGNLDGSAIRAVQQEGEIVLQQEWLYLHLPLVVGLTATGVGVEHVLTSELRAPLPAGERWLLCGALALCLFTLSALHHTTDTYTDRSTRIQSLYRSGAGAVVMLVAIVGTGLTSITIVGFLAVICVTQIVLDLREREPRTEVVPSDWFSARFSFVEVPFVLPSDSPMPLAADRSPGVRMEYPNQASSVYRERSEVE